MNGMGLAISNGYTNLITVESNGLVAWDNAAFQPLATILTTFSGLANVTGFLYNNGSGTLSYNPVGTSVTNLIGNVGTATTNLVNVVGLLASNLFQTGNTTLSNIVANWTVSSGGNLSTPGSVIIQNNATVNSNLTVNGTNFGNGSGLTNINSVKALNVYNYGAVPGVDCSSAISNIWALGYPAYLPGTGWVSHNLVCTVSGTGLIGDQRSPPQYPSAYTLQTLDGNGTFIQFGDDMETVQGVVVENLTIKGITLGGVEDAVTVSEVSDYSSIFRNLTVYGGTNCWLAQAWTNHACALNYHDDVNFSCNTANPSAAVVGLAFLSPLSVTNQLGGGLAWNNDSSYDHIHINSPTNGFGVVVSNTTLSANFFKADGKSNHLFYSRSYQGTYAGAQGQIQGNAISLDTAGNNGQVTTDNNTNFYLGNYLLSATAGGIQNIVTPSGAVWYSNYDFQSIANNAFIENAIIGNQIELINTNYLNSFNNGVTGILNGNQSSGLILEAKTGNLQLKANNIAQVSAYQFFGNMNPISPYNYFWVSGSNGTTNIFGMSTNVVSGNVETSYNGAGVITKSVDTNGNLNIGGVYGGNGSGLTNLPITGELTMYNNNAATVSGNYMVWGGSIQTSTWGKYMAPKGAFLYTQLLVSVDALGAGSNMTFTVVSTNGSSTAIACTLNGTSGTASSAINYVSDTSHSFMTTNNTLVALVVTWNMGPGTNAPPFSASLGYHP
jgi:VCBS repeat-containing protein